jgi:lipid II:glycine glycyltransferase (peptidoglycan interpeptide bridge formation enzyme)
MSQSLELADGFSAVSGRFSSSFRRNVRKAERGHITVEWGEGPRLVPVFDALYRTSVARWAERQHEPRGLAQWRARRRDPPRKFQLVAERLGAACRIGVAWRSGVPAAAIIVLAHAEHSTYWRGAMDQTLAAGTGANELLHSTAIEDACRAGRRWYHMGDSAPGSSLAEFKRRLGAEEEHYSGYRLERWPLSAGEELLRTAVKRLLRFRD